MERAAKVAGARFYYLKNDLVRLNQALIHYALDYLSEKEYSLVQPPYMINRESMEGAVITDDFEEVIYKFSQRTLPHSVLLLNLEKQQKQDHALGVSASALATRGRRGTGHAP